MKHLIAAIPLVLLAACQTPDATQRPPDDHCGASSRQQLVGTLASELDRSALPKATRIIHPNTVATMDYVAHRLNVHVDKAGRISRVVCG